jgi:hypothetical protein
LSHLKGDIKDEKKEIAGSKKEIKEDKKLSKSLKKVDIKKVIKQKKFKGDEYGV